MPRVSRKPLSKNQINTIVDHFSSFVISLTKETEIESFFHEFLTKEEKLMLAKRLVLFMMITKEYHPFVIQSGLNISYETVRTYSNQLADKSVTFRKLIDRLVAKEESKLFWDKLNKYIKPLELLLASKHDMKARAKFVSGDWS